jgi:hypothetical protein
MLEDAAGWTQAEQDEMANHKRNNSFTLLTQSDFEKVALAGQCFGSIS